MISEQQLDMFIGSLATEQSTLSGKLNGPVNADTNIKQIMSDLKDINQVLTILYKLSEKLKKKSKDSGSDAPVAKEASKKKRSK